jgi:hypothetical protein
MMCAMWLYGKLKTKRRARPMLARRFTLLILRGVLTTSAIGFEKISENS